MAEKIRKKSITVTVSKICMRIPAIFYDLKEVICHARSKRPVWTVRVNMTKNTILALFCEK
jgi:hypothetical protein